MLSIYNLITKIYLFVVCMKITKGKLKHVKREGVVAIIINKRRVLLLKRRNLPF